MRIKPSLPASCTKQNKKHMGKAWSISIKYLTHYLNGPTASSGLVTTLRVKNAKRTLCLRQWLYLLSPLQLLTFWRGTDCSPLGRSFCVRQSYLYLGGNISPLHQYPDISMLCLCQEHISINPHIKENFIFQWDKRREKGNNRHSKNITNQTELSQPGSLLNVQHYRWFIAPRSALLEGNTCTRPTRQ